MALNRPVSQDPESDQPPPSGQCMEPSRGWSHRMDGAAAWTEPPCGRSSWVDGATMDRAAAGTVPLNARSPGAHSVVQPPAAPPLALKPQGPTGAGPPPLKLTPL